MKRILLLAWLLVILVSNELFPQSRTEIRNSFFEAESWMLFEEYREALPLYQLLIKIDPDNDNYRFRIGQCYLNTPGEKEKAVGYLEQAARNINPGYRQGRFRETGAPYDVLYYLANAYRISNELDKALETYATFKKNMDPQVYDSTVINLQIESCHNAKKLMQDPVYVRKTNLGPTINTPLSEFNPVISDDENLLVFSKAEAFYDALLYSRKRDGRWSPPVNMNEILRVDRDFFPTSLSADGRELYLYSSVGYDGNIYISRFENGQWSLPVKLNDRINTKFWESHATVSRDNNRLYFTSNRTGGYGGLDIYVSTRERSGDWGPPVNLGPVINTPYNEESPFLAENDRKLFFSSRGHFNIGGYDIFYSEQTTNGGWTKPVNAGYPLNTTDDDLFFKPLDKGFEGYIARYSPGGFGRQDIYRVQIFSDKNPRRFFVMGMAKTADLAAGIADRIKITVVDLKKTVTLPVFYSSPSTGGYELSLNHGVYEFTYEAEGAENVKRIIDLPVSYPSDTMLIPATILPKTDFTAELTIEGSSIIYVTNNNPVVIRLRAEPLSELNISHLSDGRLVSSQKIDVTDPSLTHTVIPLQGENRIQFSLRDNFSNVTRAEVLIVWIADLAEAPVTGPEYTGSPAGEDSIRSEDPDKPAERILNPPEEQPVTAVPEEVPSKKIASWMWIAGIITGIGFLILLLILFLRRRKRKESPPAP